MSKWNYKFKTTPDPYQLEAVKRAVAKNVYGVFFQQRVGKSKVAIDYCGVKHLKDGIKRVLILCPLSVRLGWLDQLQEHLGVDYEAFLIPKTEAGRAKVFTHKTDKLMFIVCNYDLLRSVMGDLKRWKPDTLILDESHLLKNHNSMRHKMVYDLARIAPNRLLLTGTPVAKAPHDIYGQFRILNSEIFGKWAQFKEKFCVLGGYMGKQIVKHKNLSLLSDIMADWSMRVLRTDVMSEPEVEHITLPFELEPKAQKLYLDLKHRFVHELESEKIVTADMAITRLMKLHQICGGWLKDDEGNYIQVSGAKQKTAVDFVETKVDGGESVVIFHRFSKEGVELADALRRKEIKVAEFNGRTPEKDRNYAREAFQSGEVQVIIMQISTGAMGISLDNAHTVLFYSMDFSLSNYQQARDRVMGRFQKSDVVSYYYLAAEKSVDKKVIDTLKSNEDIASLVSDKWRYILEV